MTEREHLFLSTDPESLTGIDFTINARIARRLAAQAARTYRDQLAVLDLGPSNLRYIVRTVMREGRTHPWFYHSTPNPHPLRLRRRLQRMARYVESTWVSHDTEYYSACGWDDYQGMLRDEARRDMEALDRVLSSTGDECYACDGHGYGVYDTGGDPECEIQACDICARLEDDAEARAAFTLDLAARVPWALACWHELPVLAVSPW